jgi:hypothetical protein
MRIILLFFVFVGFISCEKDIELNLEKTPNQLVIDASIENGKPPVVILSKSLNYFNKINKDSLAASFVHNADVKINTGVKMFKLTEDSIKNTDGFIFYYYTTKPGPDLLLGAIKSSYSLKINVNGAAYDASTTIPDFATKIDSTWWEEIPGLKDSNNIRILSKLTDTKGLGDYIRYFTKVNNANFFPGLNSASADELYDGLSFTTFFEKGVDRNIERSRTSTNFNKGDTVVLKLCNIDKVNFDFWRTLDFGFQSNGNPFSSPVKILSNIQGNAFGYFGGYAAQYRTVIIPK